MRNEILQLLLVVVVCVLAASCAGSLGKVVSIPVDMTETVQVACATYQQVRPQVIELRKYAAGNWDKIPPDVQETLADLDKHLPDLDRSGALLCEINELLALGRADEAAGRVRRSGLDWDKVLSVVIRAAGAAAKLKAQGAF
jgi:hypothetical protein